MQEELGLKHRRRTGLLPCTGEMVRERERGGWRRSGVEWVMELMEVGRGAGIIAVRPDDLRVK